MKKNGKSFSAKLENGMEMRLLHWKRRIKNEFNE